MKTSLTFTGLLLTGALLSAAPVCAAARIEGPQGGPDTITLPLADYDRLAERAALARPTPEPAPVAATLSTAVIRARIGTETIRGTIELTGEVLREGLAELPLVSGATLVEARSPAGLVALRLREVTHVALLEHAGPFTLTLDFTAPITSQPGRAIAVLPTPLARAAALRLEIPRAEADLRLEGGLVTGRRTTSGLTVLEAALEPGRAPQLSWTMRETAAAPVTTGREARWLADVKTLATVHEADLRVTVLLDVSVLSGAPDVFSVRLPPGLDLVGTSGVTLDSSQRQGERLELRVTEPTRRRHQFLVSLERAVGAEWRGVEVPLIAVEGAQRETGEVAVEAVGTLELTAREQGTLKRIDLREASQALRTLAQQAVLATFRYRHRPSEPPRLTLDVARFPDAAVPDAVADRGVVTTLLTSEGRTLTEVALTIRNHAQPYLRVRLPEGASLLTAEVAGEKVKPVAGLDGARVPLLRTGFRPSGPYAVSFTYVTNGSPLGKRGSTRLSLAAIDVPVAFLDWEIFVPQNYRAKTEAGNVQPPASLGTAQEHSTTPDVQYEEAVAATRMPSGAGMITGTVTDPTGNVVPGATVTATSEATAFSQKTTSNAHGNFALLGFTPGLYTVEAYLAGFKAWKTTNVRVDSIRGVSLVVNLNVGDVVETISVSADREMIPTSTGAREGIITQGTIEAGGFAGGWGGSSGGSGDGINLKFWKLWKRPPKPFPAPSSNVVALQQRASGVLPVKIDIPRAGTSYRFVRPLVVDDETTVTFRYKRKGK